MKSKLLSGKSSLSVALATTITLTLSGGVSAKEIFIGDNIQGSFDNTLSVGTTWRTESADSDLAANDPYLLMVQDRRFTQANKNDANNNFDTGAVSSVYKITSELGLDWNGQYGFFLRGSAFYDSVIMGNTHDGGQLLPSFISGDDSGYGSDYNNNGVPGRFTDDARRYAGSRARILDAYVWGDFYIADKPLNVRLGQQVISWGEALFLQNGINSANPLELNTLRLPGAELKEAFIPLDAVYFQYPLTDTLTAEAFYMMEWKPSEDAPAGTYYSTHDAFPGKGGDNVLVDGNALAVRADPTRGAVFDSVMNAIREYNTSLGRVEGRNYPYLQHQVTLNRGNDLEAKDNDQFGFAFRWYAEKLNNTEFGFYAMNYHSHLPIPAATVAGPVSADPAFQAAALGSSNPGAYMAAAQIDRTVYRMYYPEDIEMYGISFNTVAGSVSLSGELAYRPNQPVSNEVGDNLIVGLAGAAPDHLLGNPSDMSNHCFREGSASAPCMKQNIKNFQTYYIYEDMKTLNGSLVSIFNFGPKLGTDGLVALLETGFTYLPNLKRTNEFGDPLHYNSTAAVLSTRACANAATALNCVTEARDVTEPFDSYLDSISWGYRLVLRADYNNVFAGVLMRPQINISHDVNGNSPLGGNFMEGRKAATLGVDFIYLNNLQFSVQGTSFWGAGYRNKLNDRNNASVAFKYSF